MDITTLQATLDEVVLMRTRMYMNDLSAQSDFTMGKVVAMDHVIQMLRDTIEHEDLLRSQEVA